eukprot:CAMPEP_0195519734 /NCGR_PEP_ID=MMETSP0794_2-20130614/15365_1 /TAXON_ID=515487 /ORGANISM="Stephanopyxis turris, Strain CCMP 815" /LENGTH=436 /DNA_ID=CAMNT_0040648937 /DNA_START=669 /DNA_END=1979 /DNA_ORIENTATION=+
MNELSAPSSGFEISDFPDGDYGLSEHESFPEHEQTRIGDLNSESGLGKRNLISCQQVQENTWESQMHRRLASAGFDSQAEITFDDELRSRYSESLESLRYDVADHIPDTEDMMSRAIITAFSEDDDAGEGSEKSCSRTRDSMEVEADALWSTLTWLESVRDCPDCDKSYRKLDFMQQIINNVVSKVKEELISAAAAKYTIYSVAAVLQFETCSPLPQNTVVLFGLAKQTSRSDVREALEKYGEIKAVALARGNFGFGLCRFNSTSAVERTVNESIIHKIDICGIFPKVVELHLAAMIVCPPTPILSDIEFRNKGHKRSSSSISDIYFEDDFIERSHPNLPGECHPAKIPAIPNKSRGGRNKPNQTPLTRFHPNECCKPYFDQFSSSSMNSAVDDETITDSIVSENVEAVLSGPYILKSSTTMTTETSSISWNGIEE